MLKVAPSDELVTFRKQHLQYANLGGYLAATNDGHKGAHWRCYRAVQKAQLLVQAQLASEYKAQAH